MAGSQLRGGSCTGSPVKYRRMINAIRRLHCSHRDAIQAALAALSRIEARRAETRPAARFTRAG